MSLSPCLSLSLSLSLCLQVISLTQPSARHATHDHDGVIIIIKTNDHDVWTGSRHASRVLATP